MNNVKTIIKPVIEEAADLVKTAGGQITGETSKEETQELVKDIYKPAGEKSTAEIVQNKIKDKENLKKTRAKLAAHQRYFQNEFNRPKPKEEPVAEKLEREKKQEMVDLQKKEAKKPPLAVQRAQNIEKNRGSSG